MKRLLALGVGVLTLFLWMTTVSAGPSQDAVKPLAGVDWKARVLKDRAIMKRASDLRNALKREELQGRREQIQGFSVEAYNAMVLERNGRLNK